MLTTARNAAGAVRALHQRGYVVGDVNEVNFLAAPTAMVTLVDTDSFQVRDPRDGTVFRCEVGRPEFTPPELQGRVFPEFDRLQEHDLFGLAVLVFQLLMEGTHPFAGVYPGGGDPPELHQRILAGHCPYGANGRKPLRPSPSAPPFETLPPELKRMFVECFEAGHREPGRRPTAEAWRNALAEAARGVTACPTNPQHRYAGHLSACPRCTRAARMRGLDPFPSAASVRRGAHLQPPGPARTQSASPPAPPAVRPSPAPAAAARAASARPSGISRKAAWGWAAAVFLLLALLVLPRLLRQGGSVMPGAGAAAAGSAAPAPEPPVKPSLPQVYDDRLKCQFVQIPAGEFTMGSTEASDEKPHRVRLTREFELQATEVTQAQWEAVMGGNPSSFKGPDRPVESVSWDEPRRSYRS